MRDHLVENEEEIERPSGMKAASRDSMKMDNIIRGSGAHLESSGRITFLLNTVKNGPMWYF